MIERRPWVSRHDPHLHGIDLRSPLTVGNGGFAFTADVSGLQTLYDAYAGETPLCTMAEWGWHSVPADIPARRYTLADVEMDRFDHCGREVTYPVTRHPGNEQAYDWLRQNPHKANLARVGLRLDGAGLTPADFSGIDQKLDLYSGTLESAFTLRGARCRVITACDPDNDALAFQIESDLLPHGLSVDLDFSFGAPGITGADWRQGSRHQTSLSGNTVRRTMDDLRYTVDLDAPDARITQSGAHRITITSGRPFLSLALSFSRQKAVHLDADAIRRRSADWWRRFWEKGAILDFSNAADPRAAELERRIVLSLYLLAVNSSGRMPPAETGLTCNSWYGKFHLEMHFWHMGWAPLWGHGELLARSLPWYHAHLPQARANAARNGYKGARWPKMVAEDALDSPSPIAVLLLWQQPHILILLDLLRRACRREDPDAVPSLLRSHWPLVRETADFMADFAVPDRHGIYHLEPPVIPVQERYDPRQVRDPAFETAYWKFGLGIALDWARALGATPPDAWRAVHAGMASPPRRNGFYAAHANVRDDFTDVFNDHPSMLQCFGLLPGKGMDPAAMARTLDAVLDRWDFSSLWGWDFAVMAMTAARLGRSPQAIDLLLRDTPKNTYMVNGHNRQEGSASLPLYLPGNGSLLLACAMLAAGWADSNGVLEQKDGWKAAWQGLQPWY